MRLVAEKYCFASDFDCALLSVSLLNRVPGCKMSALKLLFPATHTGAHTRTPTHTYTHSSPRLYRRILYSHASLAASRLTPLQQSTKRQSLNINLSIYINSLTPPDELQKPEDALASALLVRVFFPVPPSPSSSSCGSSDLQLSPLQAVSQILTKVNILSPCMRLRFPDKLSVLQKASLFLLRCRASPRAFLDAGAFE